jgi:inosine triphosphate pyrophosphatase
MKNMPLQFITGSKDKFAEVKSVLGALEQLTIDLPEIQEIDSRKIIEAKLNAAREHHEGAFIVEDTSLTFDGMNGLPGPLIKWFLKTLGNEGLYALAKTFGNCDAEAKTVIGYADENGNVEYFEGSLHGTINAPRGDKDFGWGPIFMPDGHDKTYGEMERDEKSALSMRAVAARKLKDFLESR